MAKSDLAEVRLVSRTRLSLMVLGAGACLVIGLASWIASSPEDAGIPGPLRRALDFNGRVWSGLFSPGRPAHGGTPDRRVPRVNGKIGLDDPGFKVADWALTVDSPGRKLPPLKLADLQWAPATESSTEFRCIEGWSEPVSYEGLRFSDFMRHFGLGRRSGGEWPAAETAPSDLLAYVGLETPDQEYYVSIDMESMLHPQTELAWAMNGQPLSLKNGAPLRLIIPVKYGIKSLKRVGRIFFSDERPPDYWQEQGYDWFAGL